MGFCALFTFFVLVSSTLAAAGLAEQTHVVELIQDLQDKYDAKLETYSSKLASYEAKVERYEQQIYQYEAKLKAYDAKIKKLEEKARSYEEVIERAEEPSELAANTAVSDVEAEQKDKIVNKADLGTPGRSRRFILNEGEIPVAFYAQLTRDQAGVGNYQAIVFDLVTTNIGKGYNHADGVFTAPVSGVYAFIWTASNNDNSHMQTELVLNAAVEGRQWSDSGNHADISSATGSVVLRLNATDAVWVRSNTIHSHVIMGQQLSSFSGWLLF